MQHGRFPCDAKPLQIFKNRRHEFRTRAARINVFDAQKKAPAETLGHLEPRQCGKSKAKMKRPIGRGGEPEDGWSPF